MRKSAFHIFGVNLDLAAALLADLLDIIFERNRRGTGVSALREQIHSARPALAGDDNLRNIAVHSIDLAVQFTAQLEGEFFRYLKAEVGFFSKFKDGQCARKIEDLQGKIFQKCLTNIDFVNRLGPVFRPQNGLGF